jgi:hypothetical protein
VSPSTFTDDIRITWRTPGVIGAVVRDPVAGVVEVRWSSSTGWICSCPDGESCAHVLAVAQLTDKAMA